MTAGKPAIRLSTLTDRSAILGYLGLLQAKADLDFPEELLNDGARGEYANGVRFALKRNAAEGECDFVIEILTERGMEVGLCVLFKLGGLRFGIGHGLDGDTWTWIYDADPTIGESGIADIPWPFAAEAMGFSADLMGLPVNDPDECVFTMLTWVEALSVKLHPNGRYVPPKAEPVRGALFFEQIFNRR